MTARTARTARTASTVRHLRDLPASCFDGVVPAALATVAPDGTPNATWLSQVFSVDERHLALSCQFFRKSRENLSADPRAQLLVTDPESYRQFRLDVRLARRESQGPVFEKMAARIAAVASLSGMQHAFALQSADVFEVMMVSEVRAGVTGAPQPEPRVRDPLAALARISEGIAACRGLEPLVQTGLELLSLHLGHDALSLYLADASDQTLYALASRGYPASGVGARIAYGVGLIGTVARQRTPLRVGDMARELRYGRVVREQVERAAGTMEREVPLPGVPGAVSVLSVPLVLDGELFGVLSTESTSMLAFDERDVQQLSIAGQVFAQAIARAIAQQREDELEVTPHATRKVALAAPSSQRTLKVRYYDADDSIFLDGEYLIKGLPGRILWLLLTLRRDESRDSFSNRELRLHPALKLPGYKDNLETRLLMLQRRLQDKASPLRISREQRGRLSLSCELPIVLELERGA